MTAAAALLAAKEHWAHVLGSTRNPEALAEAADRLCIQLRAGLGRWIGVEGFAVVHQRARGLAHDAHPVLRFHAFEGGDYLATIAAVRTHGEAEVEKGIVGYTAAIIELLGRVVSRRMAIRLVEQTAEPSPRGIEDSDTEEPFDGEEE